MGDVVELDSQRPHAQAPIECAECGHTWRAVFPAHCKSLECPGCHRWIYIFRVQA